jgi:hypothetical protein
MCYLQPLVRSLARYRTRYLGHAAESRPSLGRLKGRRKFRPWQQAIFWSPAGRAGRTELLHEVIGFLKSHRCSATIDTGWSDSDLEVFRGPWTAVKVRTVQEEHGHGDRLVRVAYQMRLTVLSKVAASFAAATAVFLACFSGLAACTWLGTSAALFAVGWGRWAWLAARIDEVVRELADKFGWLRQSRE